MRILVTGAAGFIGMHTAQKLVAKSHEVIGLDNINAYYDTSLKYGRLNELGIIRESIFYNKLIEGKGNFKFIELDLTDPENLMALFAQQKFDIVVNLAAQAGVRYSITNPKDYIESNIIGFYNILEACKAFPVKHLIFASSSSVYGNNNDVPFKTTHNTDKPISLYAATKKTNELLAFNYAHLFKVPSTGLRFFTVYGPWGRPDMAYYSFTKNIIENKTIELFNNGDLKRDFTYVDDIVEAIDKLLIKIPNSSNEPPHTIFNIGNQHPVGVLKFVNILESLLAKKAIIEMKPMQAGDVEITYSDTNDLEQLIDFKPNTPLEIGLERFVNWYKKFYK